MGNVSNICTGCSPVVMLSVYYILRKWRDDDNDDDDDNDNGHLHHHYHLPYDRHHHRFNTHSCIVWKEFIKANFQFSISGCPFCNQSSPLFSRMLICSRGQTFFLEMLEMNESVCMTMTHIYNYYTMSIQGEVNIHTLTHSHR